MSVTSAQAISLLENVLFESATVAKANAPAYVALSNGSNAAYSTVAGLAAAFAGFAEATIPEQVIRYYEGALGRAPAGSEIAYYVNIAEAGLSADQISVGASAVSQATWNTIAADFANSPEFQFATGGSNNSVINALYLNILGRSASTTEIAYYNAQLQAGLGASTLVQEFVNSPEYANNVASGLQTSLATYGAGVTTGTVKSSDPLSNGISGGTTPGGKYVLTAGVDSLTGVATGNNTFTAADVSGVNNFGPADVINGGGGTGNSLVIATSSAFTTPPGATVTNIQTATITSASTVTVNTTSWTGLTTLNVNDANDSGSFTGVSITAGGIVASATTNVNELNARGTVLITGGDVVTVKESGAGQTIISQSAAGAVNITDTGANGGIIVNNAGGVATVIANGKTGGNVAIVGSTPSAVVSDSSEVVYATRATDLAAASAANAAATAATTADTKATGVVTALATLAGALTASATVGTVEAATLTAEQAGALTFAQMQSINAAFYDAIKAGKTVAQAETAVTAILTPLQSAAVTAKSAADSAKTAATHAATTANTKLSNDYGVADLGVGTSGAKGLTSISVTGNYEAGTMTIADGSTLTNVLTTVTLNDAASANITGKSVATVNLSNAEGTTTVVNNTTANHAITFNLSNVASISNGTPTIQDNNAGSVTLNVTGANDLDVNATAATKLTITGAGSFRDESASTELAAAAVIDASAATGKVTMNVGAGQTFKGGSGGSTVITGTVAQTKAVDGGSGTNTLVIAAAAAVAGSTAAGLFSHFSVIDDAATSGTIDLSTLSNSTVSSLVVSAYGATVSGINAATAAAVTDIADGSGALTLNVSGATQVGQTDTLHITMADNVTSSSQTLSALNVAGVENVHLTLANGVTVSSLTGAPALTSLVVDGKGTFALTTGALALNVNTVLDASAVNGAVTVDAHLATGNAVAIYGTNGTHNNTLTGNGYGDVFHGGNGNDVITNANNATATAAVANINQVVTDGDGINLITLGVVATGTGATDTITVGNGINYISDANVNGTVKVTVGTGSNVVDLTAGTSATYSGSVTLGTHAADAGADVVLVAASAAAPASAQTVITGAVTGDIVGVADATSYHAISSTAQTTITGLGTGQLSTAITDALNDLSGLSIHEATSFQYGGNTYVIEASAARTTALGTGDTLVEIKGLHTFSTTLDTSVSFTGIDNTHAVHTYAITTGGLVLAS